MKSLNKNKQEKTLFINIGSARWLLGIKISKWKGKDRLDVRIYNPEKQPTTKGISLPLEAVFAVVDGILEVYTMYRDSLEQEKK